MAFLIVREPGRVQLSADLPDDCERFDIGREPDNDLVLADRQVSRKHARLRRVGDGYVIADLGATHGLFVNGGRVHEARLGDGDVIQVGKALVTFHAQATPELAPPVYRSAGAATAPADDAGPEARRLHVIFAASRLTAAAGDPLELLGGMLDAALGALGCQRGVVGLGDSGMAVARGNGEELVVSRAHIEAMLRRHESVFVADARTGPAPATLRRQDVRSAIGAPLLAGADVLGFLYVDDRGRHDPFAPADVEFLTALAHLCAAALARTQAQHQLAALRAAQVVTPILGDSAPMQEVRAAIAKYARAADAPVLILGETGSGKELVAWHIHAQSARAAQPFVPVNCAALPEALIEAELFGHEKGAFTGAARARRGRFALANCGTLFLDEIGDLSAAAQAKILRALEDGEILPLGAEAPVHVDVRVLSATHVDLAAEVAAGRFREDLYYRLRVGEIQVPPLRARGDDVVKLAAAFLETSARRQRKRLAFGPAALAALRAHAWPGNVRQLENEVERATILAEGPTIETLDLKPGNGAAPAPPGGDWSELQRRRRELDDAEREVIAGVLRKHGGVVARAARELGMPRTSLANRIEVLGVKA